MLLKLFPNNLHPFIAWMSCGCNATSKRTLTNWFLKWGLDPLNQPFLYSLSLSAVLLLSLPYISFSLFYLMERNHFI